MNTLIKLSLAPVIALTAMLTFGVQASVEDTVEQTFELSGKGQLVIDNVNGDIAIEAWQQNTVKVTANITASNQKSRDRIDIIMKQNGDRITVETDYLEQDGDWGRNSNGGSVNYTVMVPVNLDLRNIELVNGSLTVSNVAGELNADVVNGSVEATGLASNVEVDSVNGGVELTFADNAKNIEIEVETVNGGIRLYVPENFGANVEASTGNGAIKTDFGLAGTKGKYYGNDLEGSFGDASSDIEVESVNGSIRILKK